jgi:eukaryotic-like serine/threonine-protein kinase
MERTADRGSGVLVGVELPERYEPIRRIARGGMASVWCARDRTLDRHVAIKLLAEPYVHDELAGRRFKREARTAAHLSGHSNVVTIYDVGQAAPSDDVPLGRPFLVMEYLPGGTVADALRTGSLDRAISVRWLHEAAAALDYAHRRGVIHRDVKLANFLLDRERVLHVADFGIAQLGSEDTLTASGQVMGTAAYLAPEQALGQPATEASDRYALGVAAFELLVGERPFTAEHFAAQARQHVEDPPPRASLRNPTLPAALDAVLMRGMAKRPERRFASAHELVDAIDAALVPTRPLAGTVPARSLAGTVPARSLVGTVPARSASRASALPPARAVADSPRRAGRTRMAAAGALAAGLIGVAVAAGASHSGSTVPTRATAHVARPSHPHLAQHARPARPVRARPRPVTTASRPATPSPAKPPVAQPATPTGAAGLEAQGHQLMLGGNYASAISVLRQAVATAPPSSLTYAYALYDLGRSLRLAGDPRAAVPILWQRLQIPNQTNEVRGELALALEALGQSQTPSGGAAPTRPPGPPGHHHGHGKDAAPSGPGAGPGQGD